MKEELMQILKFLQTGCKFALFNFFFFNFKLVAQLLLVQIIEDIF